ncbi:MAG: dTMP kinase [Pseudomonadales bacterium]
MIRKTGKFVTLEGIEGVGKSSNMAVIEETLRRHGIPSVLTREPGGTVVSERVRELLLDRETTMSPMTELLLMFAARVQHVEGLIKPALATGSWVICDRFTDSTYAYQGGGRAMDPRRIEQLEDIALAGFQPDITIVLDVPVELGMSRAGQRSEQDRFEQEDLAFFERARAVFLERAASHERYHVIDASSNLGSVNDQVALVIENAVEAARES